MTRKHYKLLAEAFARLQEKYEGPTYMGSLANEVLDEVEDEVCIILNDDNPEFSHQKFTDASGRRD